MMISYQELVRTFPKVLVRANLPDMCLKKDIAA